MKEEEILTIEQLRESIFESRTNKIMLDGIRIYFKRNHEHYSLQEVFEINAMILGAFDLYHGKITLAR